MSGLDRSIIRLLLASEIVIVATRLNCRIHHSNTKFLVFDTQCLVFNANFLVFITKFIIFTHVRQHARRNVNHPRSMYPRWRLVEVLSDR